MVKTINITLEDAEHEELKELKGDITWEDALRKGCRE